MYCANCGKQIDDDSKFCMYCGSEVRLHLKDNRVNREHIEDNEGHIQSETNNFLHPNGESSDLTSEPENLISISESDKTVLEPIIKINSSLSELEKNIEEIRPQLYDETYEVDYMPAVVGFILLIVGITLYSSSRINFSNYEDWENIRTIQDIYAFYNLVVRIGAAIWAYRIAKHKNRNQVMWCIGGIIFPALTLIILGYKKKYSIKH